MLFTFQALLVPTVRILLLAVQLTCWDSCKFIVIALIVWLTHIAAFAAFYRIFCSNLRSFYHFLPSFHKEIVLADCWLIGLEGTICTAASIIVEGCLLLDVWSWWEGCPRFNCGSIPTVLEVLITWLQQLLLLLPWERRIARLSYIASVSERCVCNGDFGHLLPISMMLLLRGTGTRMIMNSSARVIIFIVSDVPIGNTALRCVVRRTCVSWKWVRVGHALQLLVRVVTI